MLTSLQQEQLLRTEEYVKNELATAEAGHDWQHVQRVLVNAKAVLQTETADEFTVLLACLLHDIADAKFHHGDEEIGPKKASAFLKEIGVDSKVADEVVFVVKHISFKSEAIADSKKSMEFKIVQDADRLDAIGAIGIARAFHYGGYKNRALFIPELKPQVHASKEAYKKSASPTIHHFYEKLLLLKNEMHTATAKQLAQERHDFMLQFLHQFYKEWGCEGWDSKG